MLDKVRFPEAYTLTQEKIEDYLLGLAQGHDASPILKTIAHHSRIGSNTVVARRNHGPCKRAGNFDMSSLAAFDCIVALHQASSFHDDRIEGRSSRRGNPLIGAKYGDAAAIDVGDHLFSVAYAPRVMR